MGLAGPDFPRGVFFVFFFFGAERERDGGDVWETEPSPRPLAAPLRPFPNPLPNPREGEQRGEGGEQPPVWTPLYVKPRLPSSTWLGVAVRCPPRIPIPMVTGQKGPFSHGTGCPPTRRGVRRPHRERGRGAAAPTGPDNGAGASPEMLRDSEEGSPLSALLLLLPAPRAPVGAGQAGSKRFAASVLPAFTPGQCDSHSRWKWEKRELSPFFFLLSSISRAGFTHPEPPGEGWDAQELPRACPAPGLLRLQLPGRLRAAG